MEMMPDGSQQILKLADNILIRFESREELEERRQSVGGRQDVRVNSITRIRIEQVAGEVDYSK